MNCYVLKTVTSKNESGKPVITIPRNAKVVCTGKAKDELSEVVYYDKIGWVPSVLLEGNTWEEMDFLSNRVVIEAELTSPEPVNAVQYLKIGGKLKYNLCGQFCVAHVAGLSIGTMLNLWKTAAPLSYDASVGKDRPTGIPFLQSMLTSVHLESQPFISPFVTKEGYLFSAKKLAEKCEAGWAAIVGVKINGSGDVTSQGLTSHWVVINFAQQTQRQNGTVTLYNPFSNGMEQYSFQEVIASMTKFGNATGLWIKP